MDLYYDIRIPESGNEFEKLTQTVFESKFGIRFERYGHNGEKQNGIDLFGNNFRICVQCKNYQGHNAAKRLLNGIEADFYDALIKFCDSMQTYILATSVQRNTAVQDKVSVLARKHPNIEIMVFFWEDFQEELRQHPELIRVHNQQTSFEHTNTPVPDATNIQFKVAFSGSEGSLFLYSPDSKSKEQACQYSMPQKMWTTFQLLIRRYVAMIFHTSTDYVVVTLHDRLDGKKCAPVDGYLYFDKEFRINFGVSYLSSEMNDNYDSFHVDVSHSFKLSFFKNGDYIFHNIPAHSKLEDLKLDGNTCVALSKDLLEFLYPNHAVIVSDRFMPKVYSDSSGGFYLSYLVK